MKSHQFLFLTLLALISLPLPATVLSLNTQFLSENNQLISAGVADFFNAFKRDVGQAFEDMKDLVSGNADSGKEDPVEQAEKPAEDPASKSAEDSNLKPAGLTRTQNREIQRLLADAGYYPGPIDGLPGIQTIEAISKYQQAKGLPVDGRPTLNLLADLRASQPTDDFATKADLAPEMQEIVKASELVEETYPTVEPFGIPLGEKYSEDYFKRVFNFYDQQSGDATVHPTQPHPLFNQYSISISDGFIVKVHAAYSTSLHRTMAEPMRFNSISECNFTANSIANALEEKYGKGQRYGKAGKWELIISNARVQIRYFARCGLTKTSTNISLSFQNAGLLSQQDTSNDDGELKVQENVINYNHVF